MANSTAVTQTTNLVPVQGIFEPEPTFALVDLIGPAGSVFYPNIDPQQSGLSITNSTIDSSIIGGTSPAAGYFTTLAIQSGTVATSPSANTDIANKAYVDSVAQGLDIKASCLYGTTNNITLSGLGIQAGGDWVSSLTAGDRILVKSQTNSAENGIYLASASGWTRSLDMNTWSEVPGAFTFIEEGATLISTGWVTTAGHTGTIGVTAMPWTQFSGAGTYTAGNGLQLIANVFSVKPDGTSLSTSASGVKIASTWPGQTSITTLGTIATGTWNADTIAVLHGGTGATTAADARTNLGAAASGANSDITSLSGLTGGVSSPAYIDFNTTTAVPAAVAGRMYWDNTNGNSTVSLVMAGGDVIQQIGEEQYYRIRASADITNGQVVMFSGTIGATGVLKGAPATGLTAETAVYVMGVATQDIGLGKYGYVTSFGLVRDIDTRGGAEAWVDGQILYLDPAVPGGLTKYAPSAPNPKIQVCAVVNAGNQNNGSIFVRPTFGGALGQFEGDVEFGTKASGDVVAWNGTKWTNVAQSTLSVSYAATAGSAGSSTTAVTSTNLAGGLAGSLLYQTGAGATTFLGLGSSTYILTAGASAPAWTDPASITVGSASTATSAGKATNLAGGAAASIPYQTAADTTAFLASGAGDAGKVLQSNGTSAPTWVTPTAYATVTDDTTSGTTFYPLIANATTGTLTTEYVSSTKLQFVPSTGILTATGFSGSGAALTSLPAGNLSGTIPSGVLGNSTVYIGTTAIALNRGSAIQSLTGVSIDGSAGSATSATNATNAANIAITDDTSTVADEYLVWVKNTTGNLPA